jgi:quercetin dioxygenase-like cupin family protein
MTKVRIGLLVFCVAVAVTIASAATMMKATVVPAGSAKWMPMTGMTGVSEAVLYGTPSKAGSGIFAELLKVSKDTTIPIHYHPNDELATVLRGTLTVGTGDKVDWSKATTLSTGGFAGVPAGLHHYAKLTAGSIIEISGTAPDTIILVKPTKTSM